MFLLPLLAPGVLLCLSSPDTSQAEASLSLRILEDDGSTPLPCRVHLTGPDGKPHRPAGLPHWRDHFNCEGTASLNLPAGEYRLLVERGPEYTRARETLKLQGGKALERVVRLRRTVHLARQGWWSGELHVHRALEDIPLLLRAEDLHVAPVLTVWNQRNLWSRRALPEKLLVEVSPDRFYHVLGCEDEREGGALLYFNLETPLDLSGQRREYPSPVTHLRAARRQAGAWVDIEKPFWWDVPAWVATGQIDSIGLANNHMCHSRMLATEAWGRPRDAGRLPPPRGNGFYTQELYYRLLNCGFRIPPSAGSASGVLPNPVGYNRVYVHLGKRFSWEGWWRGLAAGRSFVTNGPILLVEANGKRPGEVFHGPAGGPLALDLSITVSGNDPIEAIEVVRDGEIARRWPRPDGGSIRRDMTLNFERSGWFLVRAIALVPETFRFASTAPFYVEIGDRPATIHRQDVRFFLEWIDERIERIRKGVRPRDRLTDPAELEAVLAPHLAARKKFLSLLK